MHLAPVSPVLALALWALCGWALWLAFRDEIREARAQQWLALCVVVVVLAGVHLDADVPYPDQCTEAFLRQICGDQWEICWWLAGCWSLPG